MDDRERYMEEVAIEREQLRKAVEVASQEARRARRLEEEAEARKAEAASAMAERDQAVEQIEGMRNAKSRVERHAQEVEARLASREREQAERANEHSTQMQLQLDGIGEEVERLRSQLNAALSELRAERDRRDKEGVRHRGYSGGQEEAAPPTLVEELNDLRQQARGFEEERDSFRIQLAEAMQEKVEALLLLSQVRQPLVAQHFLIWLRLTVCGGSRSERRPRWNGGQSTLYEALSLLAIKAMTYFLPSDTAGKENCTLGNQQRRALCSSPSRPPPYHKRRVPHPLTQPDGAVSCLSPFLPLLHCSLALRIITCIPPTKKKKKKEHRHTYTHTTTTKGHEQLALHF